MLKYVQNVFQETNLSKFKKIEIISSTLTDHNGMKLEINNRKQFGKNTNNMEIKQPTDQRGKQNYFETN